MSSQHAVVGIDLGTSNTRVAVWQGGRVEIVPQGEDYVIPSYVAFTKRGRLIGTAAKNQAAVNPENTVFNILRFVGRNYDDPEIQEHIRTLPFKIVKKAEKPVIEVTYRGQFKQLTPEEIVSMILRKAKESAKAYLRCEVHNAVITVPAYFNYHRRQIIQDIAVVAGLNPHCLVNGATAAACTYVHTRKPDSDKTLLFLDLGAGTFDVALVSVTHSNKRVIIKVKSTCGYPHLGGDDFDDLLVEHLTEQLDSILSSSNDAEGLTTKDPRTIRRLRVAAEDAKRDLSAREKVHVQIDPLLESRDSLFGITRLDLENLCEHLFKGLVTHVGRALNDAEVGISDIDEVILTGGSFRIPRVQAIVSQYLDGKELSRFLNLDEAAVYGATILAGTFPDRLGPLSDAILLFDVHPFSFRIEDSAGHKKTLLKRNTIIPTSEISTTMTVHWGGAISASGQFQAELDVIEFFGKDNRHRRLLGSMAIPLFPITIAERQIGIRYRCDRNGRLVVKVSENPNGQQVELIVEPMGRLPSEEIDRIRTEAERYRTDEKVEADRISAKDELELYAYSLKEESCASELEKSAAQDVEASVYEMLLWLDDNQLAGASEYRSKQAALREIFHSALTASLSSNNKTENLSSESSLRGRQHGRTTDGSLAPESDPEDTPSSDPSTKFDAIPRLNLPEGRMRSAGPPSTRPERSQDVPRSKSISGSYEPQPINQNTITQSLRSLWTPLQAGEFRLLYRNRATRTLQLKIWNVDYPPKYRALSYACGHDEKNKTLFLMSPEGSTSLTLNVTRTLYDALVELAVEEIPIWVDAICINQTDLEEKSAQIALMETIYDHADHVAIWLDRTAGEHTELALDVLNWINIPAPNMAAVRDKLANSPVLQQYVQHNRQAFQIEQLQRLATVVSGMKPLRLTPVEFQRLAIPHFKDPIWQHLGRVLSPPWLFRLWTFQELMLGKDCFVAFGRRTLPWRTYFDLGMQFSKCGLLEHCIAHYNPDEMISTRTAFTRLRPFLDPGTKSVPFSQYLNEARQRQVTETVDRIYAVISLANESLRDKITVSYASGWRDKPWKLFLEVGKAVIEVHSCQTLLAGVNSKHKSKQLPSWCPDFTVPCEVVPFGEHARAGMRYGRAWTNHYNQSVINVAGARLDHVDRIVDSSHLLWDWPLQDTQELYGLDGVASSTWQWLRTCWDVTRDVYAKHDSNAAQRAFVMTMMGVIPEQLTDETDDAENAVYDDSWFHDKDEDLKWIRRRLDIMRSANGPEDTDRSVETWYRFRETFQGLADIWQNRVFFTTKKGRIGFASKRIRVGDHVCVFFGETHLYILRDMFKGLQQFVSDAYVDGYITGHGFGKQVNHMVFKIN